MSLNPDALRTLAKRARNPKGHAPDERLPERYIFDAVVLSHTGSAPYTVTLDRHGTAIPGVPYLASYTPTDGDVVRCEMIGDDVMVWGKFR